MHLELQIFIKISCTIILQRQGSPDNSQLSVKTILYSRLLSPTKVENPIFGADFPADFATWQTHAETTCHPDTAPTPVNDLAAGPRLACRLATCIEEMSHVTFANPAGEACDDIKACLMMTGDTESKESFAAMCEKPDWKYGLNQVLTAVAVLDANPTNSLDDINSLFGCETTCVFEDAAAPGGAVTNMYQQGQGLQK